MKKSTDLLIEELANDLKPGRDWHPIARAGFWFAVFFLVSTLGMLAYQDFRPHFFDQLLGYTRFSLEIISIFLVCNFFLFFIFSLMIPGRKIPTTLYYLTGLVALIWLITQWTAFGSASPASSFIGARMYCVEEVFAYGVLGVGFLFYFVYKAQFRFRLWQYFLMGFVSGLIPGALMQLACMYAPKHGLLLHYGPAFATGFVALLVFPTLKKVSKT